MTEAGPPAGFIRSADRGPFTNHIGPYFHRPSASGAEQAFLAIDRHCNGVGLIHGGMLASFLDGLLASAAARDSGGTPVTMHLSIDFLDMGRAGEWVLGVAHVARASGGIAFVEGRAHISGRDLARASGLFKILRRRPG